MPGALGDIESGRRVDRPALGTDLDGPSAGIAQAEVSGRVIARIITADANEDKVFLSDKTLG